MRVESTTNNIPELCCSHAERFGVPFRHLQRLPFQFVESLRHWLIDALLFPLTAWKFRSLPEEANFHCPIRCPVAFSGNFGLGVCFQNYSFVAVCVLPHVDVVLYGLFASNICSVGYCCS
ncbi:hypothetical protein S83_068740 [Arachis hypogaea]